MKIIEKEKIKQQQEQKRQSKTMKICNQKENLKRLKKILQLRKHLKQEHKQKALVKSEIQKFQVNSAKKEYSTAKQLNSQATIQEDYSESQTSLVSSQKKISFESDLTQLRPQKQMSLKQQNSPNRQASMSFDIFKQSSDSKDNQSSDFDYFEEIDSKQISFLQLSSAVKEPKSAKSPGKKSFVLFRYQKYHHNSFKIEIPQEYLKYIIPAYQEYSSIKKSYNKWISSTKQTEIKILSKEQLDKNKQIQVPDVLVRIPFDKVESNPQQNEEW